MEDRRVFDRFLARFPAKIKDSRASFGEDIVLRDASAAGIRILSNKKMYVNDIVDLLIFLPDGRDPWNVQAQVVWTRNGAPDGWNIGLRFRKVDFMAIQRLFNCCNVD